MNVLAQDERERITARTKSTLAELKKQEKVLSSLQNLSDKTRTKSLEIRTNKTLKDQNNSKSGSLIL